jgi:hypothetical protein
MQTAPTCTLRSGPFAFYDPISGGVTSQSAGDERQRKIDEVVQRMKEQRSGRFQRQSSDPQRPGISRAFERWPRRSVRGTFARAILRAAAR